MWIVRLALSRPYTFTVMALLILILGSLTYVRMAKDIFPAIDIPVVAVVWTYNGLSPEDMERRIVTSTERTMTTLVNDIEHIESQSTAGVGVIKVFLQPHASVATAVAQISTTCQRMTREMPPGTPPPLIITYNAANVPILQLGLGSKTISEQGLYDLAQNSLRVPLATVQGAAIPLPTGGKVRQIMVDLDPAALQARGITPSEVSAAINAQNVILPAGTAKIGEREYVVQLNNSPDLVEGLNQLPIKEVNGTTVYVRDVAQVRDGSSPQNNVVRQNGSRGALLTIMKTGDASTLDVIDRIWKAMPRIMSTLPPELDMKPLFDQSRFVKASLDSVIHEGVLAAALTALMILLFLGNWRSTLVVALSIPLSILCSIIVLSIFGQTINAMTLGGFALAVGILVDDATVTIENIERNHTMGKPLITAILDGAQQIAMPTFVATICICIVFVPIFFLEGTAKYLFSPLAMAVIFAMLASYLLSRTVVPTFVHYLLQGKKVLHDRGDASSLKEGDIFWRIHVRFNRHFERFRASYRDKLIWVLDHRLVVLLCVLGFIAVTAVFVPSLGRDYFPSVDAGQFRLHVRAPAGTRIEETERLITQVENTIRDVIPHNELENILDIIGPQNSPSNMANSDGSTIGSGDAEILVSLTEARSKPTIDYVSVLRQRLRTEFPTVLFFTQASDIVSQVLNFGLPSPIDVQIAGRDRAANYALAQKIAARIDRIPGAVDVRVHQVVNSPTLMVNVDRDRAMGFGLTQREVASNMLVSLSGSAQTSPNYWLSPQNGVQYTVATMTPQYRIDSLESLMATPISRGLAGNAPQMLRNVASVERTTSAAVVNHYNVQPVFDVFANVDGTDLGSVAGEVRKIIKEFEPQLARGSYITLRGQVQTMDDSFSGIAFGLIFAILLVYFLMVVNFQSWTDPAIIIASLPGALCGIVWMLYLTGTTLNVPSLMGSIMCVGVATANAILVVTFANDQRKLGMDARTAMIEAGYTRLRPVLMTALAMIIGMLPMALGFGEGGEQNAPLGRAVIGGLLLATVTTLFIVPLAYTALRKKAAHRPDELLSEELNEAHLPPLKHP